MAHLKLSEQNAHTNKQLLKALNEMIKTPILQQEGFEKLQEIDADELCIENQVYYYYIKAKYYVLQFKNSTDKDLSLLEYANDYYTDMVVIAYENSFALQNPKRHFSRAYCKYLIASHITSEESKTRLLVKAEQIVNRVLRNNPTNRSCLWLKSELLGKDYSMLRSGNDINN